MASVEIGRQVIEMTDVTMTMEGTGTTGKRLRVVFPNLDVTSPGQKVMLIEHEEQPDINRAFDRGDSINMEKRSFRVELYGRLLADLNTGHVYEFHVVPDEESA